MKFFRILPVVTLFAASAAFAQQAAAPGPIDRVKITDNELSCAQIHGEIGDMDKIVAEARVIEAKQKTNTTAASAAGTAAEVAGRTGLFGAIGGLTGHLFGQVAAQTAAGAVQQTSAQSAQQAGERAKQAGARKEHLTGLFLAKDCKASDLNAAGRALSGEELQKLTVAGAAASAAAEGMAPPPPADAAGASALVGQAAGAAKSAAATPVELGIGPGMNFGTLASRGQKVAVAGYRVAFVVRNSASAYAGSGVANIGQSTGTIRTITQAQNRKIEVGLLNVNRQLMQAITDQLYADFVEQLKASGKTVVTQEELLRAPSFGKLERTEATGNDAYTVSPTGDARHYQVFAPTNMPLYFIAGESLGDKGPFSQTNNKVLGSISTETQSVLLIPQVVIDFAEVESSGRSTFRSNAHVDAKPGIALVPMHTIVWAAHANNPIITEMGSRRLEKVIAFPGDYATVKTVDNFNTAGLANSLTMATGLQGVQHFSEKRAYVADPARFADLVLKSGFSANRAFIASSAAR